MSIGTMIKKENMSIPNIIMIETEFKYTFSDPIAIDDLIKGLEGYKGLINSYLPSILTDIVGVKVDSVQIFVKEMEQGSFVEKFLITLGFGSEENALNFAKSLGETIGILGKEGRSSMNRAMRILVSMSIGALITTGVIYLIPSQKKEIIQNINNINNTVIIGESTLNGEDIYNIVDAAISSSPARKRKTQQDVQKILAPIHSNGGGIIIDNSIPIASDEVLRKIPKGEINDDPNIIVKDYDDIDMNIRASDRDRTTGWYVVIDNIAPTRKKLEFADPDIDLSGLANNATVRANITVVKKLDRKGQNYIVDKIIFRSFVSDEE